MSTSPYNEVVLPLSMDDLREFFHAIPQGEEHATTNRIGALFAPHRMLAKIVQHNLWPVVRRSDLILERVFVYAIHLRLPFCLCNHIFRSSVWLPTHTSYTTVRHQYCWRAKDEDLGSTQQADADEVKCSVEER
jgi:hypothetical protein